MWTKKLLFLVYLLLPFVLFGQEERAREVVKILCSEEFYGRGYVNNGVHKAANYLAQEFENIGLQPFFGDTSYFQDFTFDVNTFPGVISVQTAEKTFKTGEDFLVDHRSGSFEGKLNLLLSIGKEIVENPSSLFDHIKQIENGEANGFLIDLTIYDDKERRQYVPVFDALSRYGVVVFQSHTKFIWSVGREQTYFPIIYFKKDVFPAEELEINIEAEFVEAFPNQNIAGYIPSKKKKAKTIVFTAHYDHLGGLGTQPFSTYFPGGNDNASGTSMLISMAEHFIKNPSKYNLLFIAFAGEEAGLLGSKHFVENESMDLSKIRFLINLDIMGSGEDGITVVNGTVHKKEFKRLTKINAKKNYLAAVKERGEAANSDHHFFHQAGVPAIFIYTMGLNQHYHDVYDTYEELSFMAYNNIVKLLIDFVGKL